MLRPLVDDHYPTLQRTPSISTTYSHDLPLVKNHPAQRLTTAQPCTQHHPPVLSGSENNVALGNSLQSSGANRETSCVCFAPAATFWVLHSICHARARDATAHFSVSHPPCPLFLSLSNFRVGNIVALVLVCVLTPTYYSNGFRMYLEHFMEFGKTKHTHSSP